MDVTPHRFVEADLIGGHPVLDFVNTATARDTTPRDWLADAATLVAWAALRGVIAAGEATALRAGLDGQEARGGDALHRARQLREALYAILAARAHDRRMPADALARLDADWKRATRRATLASTHGVVAPKWTVAGSGPDLVRDRLAAQAIALLGDPVLARLRQCDGTNCAWLFLDTSKNGRRRWCDMATCGNVAKARRHYARESAR